ASKRYPAGVTTALITAMARANVVTSLRSGATEFRTASLVMWQTPSLAQYRLAIGRAQESEQLLCSFGLRCGVNEVELLLVRICAALEVLERGLDTIDRHRPQVA